MKSQVTVVRGRHRGKTGWIHGELGRLNPVVSKVHVFLGNRIAVLSIENLVAGEPANSRPAVQLELALLPDPEKTNRRTFRPHSIGRESA